MAGFPFLAGAMSVDFQIVNRRFDNPCFIFASVAFSVVDHSPRRE